MGEKASPRLRDSRVVEAENLYRLGQAKLLLANSADASNWQLSPAESHRLRMLQAMAHFDIGSVVRSLAILDELTRLPEQDVDDKLQITFALFLRASDFAAPAELLPMLSLLRQVAAQAGNATSLASLHLAVARLEGLRGRCVDAHRHLELARRLAATEVTEGFRCSLDLVEGSLESISGNFRRARRLSHACLQRAKAIGFAKYRLGALTNLAVISLYTGNPDRAKQYLQQVIPMAGELTYVRLGASDTWAQIDLVSDNIESCQSILERCASVAESDVVPARSWYDLAHQLTRCAYYERLEDWERIVAIADDVDPELARRQYKALRTSLLCAKARALARLGERVRAQACLALAVRTCPRGAVDPLIVLETSKGVCETLHGDAAVGAQHLERAVTACRAVGHRYHERWLEMTRERLRARMHASAAMPARAVSTTDAALILTDVATILGAGHSVDLMALRTVSLLDGTPLRARVRVDSESDCEYQATPSATLEPQPDGSFCLQLRGSDRQITIAVGGAQSIEEMSLLKSVADIVQVAVTRTADTGQEDDEQNLWPSAGAETDTDVVFRSPRMIELRNIALRLADTDLPVLITGETGTGKEIFARLIHEHSKCRRGPFVPFNCSAAPRDLVESQLFGHRRGAFTGAGESFPGVIRSAERGTLFLDEVGDLDVAVQPKLLRFLENGEIQPLGEARAQHVHVRLVAATNANLDEAMTAGRFRRDLFYRLGVAQIALPPLRERKDEIPALASSLVAKFAREYGRARLTIGDDFVAALLLYHWPGNIRELVNEVRRAVAMAADGDTLTAALLTPAVLAQWNARPIVGGAAAPGDGFYVRLDQPLTRAVDALEQHFIDHALERTGGRVTEAANLLGISRKGLFLKRRRRGLVPVAEAAADR
jgi:DNA-binding NtrC family response regulator/tetratricopeptide (TPR) repeat protein